MNKHSDVLADLEQNKRCLNLIRMIIVQGLIDVNAKTKNKIRKEGKQQARDWFKKDNKYFLKICKLADVNPSYILKIYNQIRYNKNRKSCLADTLNMEKLTKLLDSDSKDYYNYHDNNKKKRNL